MTDMEMVIFQLSETYKLLEIVTPRFNQIMDYQSMIQGCKDAIALLKEQDAVVRCKDCKYRFVDGDNVRFNMCLLNHNKVQPDNWFCADGKRME